ncbi:MAG: YggW family oxidoreductase [Proteobacteria bacterium]|nr:MAG: YggW family oxidoreductase [Pseudomonadota bacterium]
MIPLSLYIHIPWCIRKCPYCDFNSHQVSGELPEVQYIDALLADLHQEVADTDKRQISSIFIGGGTPSLFSAASIQRLLDGVDAISPLPSHTEITLEANPGTFEQQRFTDYRKAGINRLSIGIQSYNPQHLKKLGRIHNAEEARHAADIAREAGFDNFNLDLMFGLPEQTITEALQDLEQAIHFNPTHLSWYQLTLEPNTLFHHQKPTLPEHEILWEMQQAGQALLAQHHFQQYEVSAYSLTGKQCLHNRNYWEFGDYLGIGAGAHGKVTSQDGSIHRYHKYRQPKQYMEKARIGEFRTGDSILTPEKLPFEFMLNALRLKHGVDSHLYEQRTGQALNTITPTLLEAQKSGLLDSQDNKIVCTERGWHFLDNTLSLFL